ncbi:MAG: hypothetical protein JWM11_4795 [Planctomycetaceae bacterium]|nr:hypothetical protein [Planctomycetaceae bacterium]
MFLANLTSDQALSRTKCLRIFFSMCIVLCFALHLPAAKTKVPNKAQEKRDQFEKSLEQMQKEFANEITKIAQFCEKNKLNLEAEEIRKLARPLASNVVQGENLPRQVQLDVARNLPEMERAWRIQLRAAQSEYAIKLFSNASKAIDAGAISLAYDLVRETARHDPDHKAARRLLGYVQHGNEWVTFYTDRMLTQKYKWTDQFGWLKGDQVERYNNGERYFNRQWMSVQREAEIRRDFKNAWEVRTDHYKIYTNHSLEMGVELGKHLEDFYRIFFQTFAGFVSSRAELKNLFVGKVAATTASEPFVVHYYRTKDEYVLHLQKTQLRNIGQTSGMYLSAELSASKGIAHFYHNSEATQEEQLSTMFHEATHQLFTEAYNVTRNKQVGVNSDFWAIEGIACYMESFQKQGENFSLGDPKYIRFQNAKYRLQTDNYFVSLQNLNRLGAAAFQNDPNIEKNYSQGAGLAHFFMHYENGLYRDEFIAYLAGIYSKIDRVRNNPPNLADLTGVPLTDLDRQYRDYIAELKTE